MVVTKIEAVAKNKYKVYLDERFAFVLYKGELSRYRVTVNEELSVEMYEKIRREVILKRGKLRALHLLNVMGRTEEQLRQKLRLGSYPEDIIDMVMDYVKSFGYINDQEYARSFIENRKDKKSRREIYASLCQKGVKSEDIDAAFQECYEEHDAREAICTLLRKKGYDPENADRAETQKILGFLVRKGFRYEDIRQVIQVSDWNA